MNFLNVKSKLLNLLHVTTLWRSKVGLVSQWRSWVQIHHLDRAFLCGIYFTEHLHGHATSACALSLPQPKGMQLVGLD